MCQKSQTKICSKCKEEKSINLFAKNKNLKDGFSGWCKVCKKEYDNRYRFLNKTKLKVQKANYYIKNPELHRELYLKNTYNISIEQYNKLLKDQNYKCAICEMTEEENGKKLAVDHDHDTGIIRGLLCIYCNKWVIGKYNSKDILTKAINYLNNNTGFIVPKHKRRIAEMRRSKRKSNYDKKEKRNAEDRQEKSKESI